MTPEPAERLMTYEQGLYAYLRALGCQSVQAEDLVQDTFATVLRKGGETLLRAQDLAYLRAIAKNLYLSSVRKSARRQAILEADAGERVWQRMHPPESVHSDLLTELRDCLGYLTDDARDAIRMRYRDEASAAEIAERLNLSESNVNTTIFRARRQLRDCIEGKRTEGQRPE